MAEASSSSSNPSDPTGSPAQRRGHWARSRHRARAHDDAHAEQGPATPDARRSLPLVPDGPPQWIDDSDAAAKLVQRLRVAGSFAYDSEFIGEMSYVPKLCLIQVATCEQVSLVDPLVPGIDLLSFWELLADPAVEKIVHAGDQDIEPVARHLDHGHGPANLFDTQIAAGFIAMNYPASLSRLVEELLGVRLGKGLTFTHWDQRPLSNQQLRYAADDVRYLPALRDQIQRRLDALGHAAWASQECQAMCDPVQYAFDPEQQYLKLRGAGGLSPKELMILKELTLWRDHAARREDVPPRTMLRDEILVDLARRSPKNIGDFARIKGLPRPVEQIWGPDILEAIGRGASISPEDLPARRHREETPAEKFQSDAVWIAAQAICVAKSIDPALLASRQEVLELHHRHQQSRSTEDLPLLQGWRRQALGEPLLNLLESKSKLELLWTAHGLSQPPGAHD